MHHPNIKIIKGKIPILVSAPHATPIIKTVKGRTYTRIAEEQAGDIVKTICEQNNTWGIFTKSEKSLEGWQEEVYKIYKELIKNTVQSYNILLVLDIHSAKKDRPFFLDYDFMLPNKHPNDNAAEKLLHKHYCKYFPESQLSKGFFREVNGTGQKTLTYYVRRYLKIPAIQLEFNRSLKENDETFSKIVKMLYSFIKDYENIIIRIQRK